MKSFARREVEERKRGGTTTEPLELVGGEFDGRGHNPRRRSGRGRGRMDARTQGSSRAVGRKSMEDGTVNVFVNQAAQMGLERRDDMMWHYGEMFQGILDKKMAVMSARWVVGEKAQEVERARLEKLIGRKNEEGYFTQGSGPDEELDFGKHKGKSFKDFYIF